MFGFQRRPRGIVFRALAASASLMCATAFVPVAVAKPATPASATPNIDADLEILANFMPRQGIRDIMIGGCTTAYRRKLDLEVDAEQALPGLHDRMIAAASKYCLANVDQTIERVRGHIKDRWRSKFSPNELHRLAVLYAPSIAAADRFRVEFKPGDTATAAMRRADPNLKIDEDDWQRRANAFAATPGGSALLIRADKESASMSRDIGDDEDLMAFMKSAFKAGHAAANAYAAEKGLEPLYAD